MPAHCSNIIDFGPVDEAGPLLRELDSAVTGLQKVDPRKLYGDAAIVASGIQALRLILDRIEALQVRTAAE